MKRTYISILTIAVALYCAPAFAQHGHGMGGPGGMGMNGMGPSTHPNANANGKAGDLSGASASASHGKTMDQLLTQNTKLADKISTLTGQQAQQACSGFKNLGQCVAAAHVSKNLKISFDCLKSDMTGTAPSDTSCPAGTGSKSISLGKSIQALSPHSDSKNETKKGQEQADQDLKDSTKSS
jgi:hypothetical protein